MKVMISLCSVIMFILSFCHFAHGELILAFTTLTLGLFGCYSVGG